MSERPADAELESWLASAVEAGRRAWPGLTPSDDAFVAHLRAQVDALPEPQGYRSLHASDLMLACACASHCPCALDAFAKTYDASMRRAMARAGVSGAAADELLGALREKLFFGTRPRIAEYSGRGRLAAWVRAVAHNAAASASAAANRNVELDELLDAPEAQVDPELGYLKTLYAGEFRTSLVHAIEALSPRERTLLRQHYIDGATVDELGKMYGVHRATAAEWVARARQALAREVRKDLAERLSLSARELESLLRLLRSDVRSSILGLLG